MSLAATASPSTRATAVYPAPFTSSSPLRSAATTALPFSAVPTGYTVVAGAVSYEANCAWDALAVPVALGRDATIDARWMDTREPVGLRVTDGSLNSEDGFVHVVVPARHWWDDIAYT